MKKIAIAAVAAATLAVPAAASAHVTLQPREAASGSFSKMDVRVPNERDNKGTIKVDVRFPDGFYFLSYQKVPGWKARVFKEKLDQPVDLGGLRGRRAVHAHRLDRQEAEARPHRARASSRTSRSRSACPTARPAAQLVFRAFQTYQRGERVAWTGAPDSDTPAPRVTLLAPEAGVPRCQRATRSAETSPRSSSTVRP